MNDLLETEASAFAENLDDLIQGCIDNAPRFFVINTSSDEQCRIGPGPFESDHGSGTGFRFVPLVRECDEGDQPRLMLKIEFRVSLDSQSEHLAVQQSTFGLWVCPDPRRGSRPVFRIEYDRKATSKPSAHIHLHAESVELGWIYGTAGLALPRLQEIHFWVGGEGKVGSEVGDAALGVAGEQDTRDYFCDTPLANGRCPVPSQSPAPAGFGPEE